MTSTTVSPEIMRARLKTLIREKSYQFGPEFTLASGKKSRHYFNMKPTMLDPEGAYLIAHLMLSEMQKLGPMPDFVGGLELGAVPIASAISPVSQSLKTPVRAFLIRKKVKDHGTKSLVEGLMRDETLNGKSVLIVEDVTTTGGSAIKAIEEVRREGARVSHVITILDREEGAQEAFNSADVTLLSLLKKTDFIDNN